MSIIIFAIYLTAVFLIVLFAVVRYMTSIIRKCDLLPFYGPDMLVATGASLCFTVAIGAITLVIAYG